MATREIRWKVQSRKVMPEPLYANIWFPIPSETLDSDVKLIPENATDEFSTMIEE